MNGLSLLFYLTLFAQTTTPLGSSAAQGFQSGANGTSPAFNPAVAPLGSSAGAGRLGSAASASNQDDSRMYGWQINEFNELEYIVQVSPSLLEFMQNPADKQELASQIPPALVGRVRRVVVKIGNDVLPRTPIDEIDKLLPAIASLPPGKLREIESGAIVNVNNATQQPGSGGFSNSNPGFSNSNSASAFAEQARGMTAQSQAQAPGSLMDRFSNSGATISGQGNRFNNTAPATGSMNPNPLNPAAQNSGVGRLADARGNLTNSQGYNNQGYVPDLTGQRATDPQALGGRANGVGPLGNNALGSGALGSNAWGSGSYANTPNNELYAQQGGQLGQQTAPYRNDNTGFGANINGNRQGSFANASDQLYSQGYANGQIPGRQGYANTTGFGDSFAQNGNALFDPRRGGSSFIDPSGLSPAGGYLASNQTTSRTDLPSTSFTQAADRNQGTRPIAGQPTDLQAGGYPGYQPTENNYFFYVFFILSLAVNLWLVHLLRSLYLRYRNLLSSLRSQATSLG